MVWTSITGCEVRRPQSAGFPPYQHTKQVYVLWLCCTKDFYCVSVRHTTSFYRILPGPTPPGLRHKIDIIAVRNLQF